MKFRAITVLLGIFIVLLALQPLLWAQDASHSEAAGKDASQRTSEINQKAEALPAGAETKAAEPDNASQLMKDADALFDKDEPQAHKQSLALYEEVLKTDPVSFEANWKAARACRYYAERSKKRNASGWEQISKEYGKKGMAYAQKAIELAPDQPQGYYYYGLSVGSYSDGVGIFTALREGLKDKTQNNLEKAYEVDKTFDKGGPIIAIGRFWQVVPWPYNDEDKAMEYYREFEKTPFFNDPDKVEAHVYMAEILMDQWGSGPKEEARKLLAEVPKIADDPYWENRARELLSDL